MFEHFSVEAKRVVISAITEAKKLSQDMITPEMILLGITHSYASDECIALEMIKKLGANPKDISRAIVNSTKKGVKALQKPPYSDDARCVYDVALKKFKEERGNHSSSYLDSSFLLLGILQTESTAAKVLQSHGITEVAIRAKMPTPF